MKGNTNNMTNSLLQNTLQQQKKFFHKHTNLLNQLTIKGQKPIGLFITCADSRLVPEKLFNMSPGQFFMLRNAGNIIPPYTQTEISIASSLEFAIKHLQSIISCLKKQKSSQ